MKMVRVLSVYHFDDGDQQNQNIGIGDEIIDTCMVGDNKIAVATPNMNVEIWDMSSNPQQQTIFPTVDEVKQICYCQNGNYFATLETKLDARNKTLSFVRIYTNWDSIEQNSEVMINFRARIAGKTTPSEKYLSSNDLEMIELPIKVHPTRIACCQITGNVSFCCDNKINFFEFRAVVKDRHEYIDFLEIPVYAELSFQPTGLSFCEGVVSCWDTTSLNIFRIQPVGESQSISLSLSSELPSFSAEKTNQCHNVNLSNKDAIDFRQVSEKKIVNDNIFRVNIMSDADDFGQCDWKPESANCMLVMLKGSEDCHLMTKYTIKCMLQLKSRRRRGFCDEFKTVSIRPFYKHAQNDLKCASNGPIGGNIFQSLHFPRLVSISVAVVTQQDAYLYNFSGLSVDEWQHQPSSKEEALVASYSFTSPVIDLVIDSLVLHALTDTGIETYALRTGERIFYEEVLRPSKPEEPVCLIGIRPVLAAQKIFCSTTNVMILISNDRELVATNMQKDDSSQFMVQSLRKPEVDVIYRNIEEFATRFRFDNPRLFVHLMNEAHVMVRLAAEMSHAIPADELNRQNLKSVPLITWNSNPDPKTMHLFLTSCRSLGDYFVMQQNEDYYMALPYYLMGQLEVNEIFDRLIQFEKNQNKNMDGVVYTLKQLFLRINSEEPSIRMANQSSASVESTIFGPDYSTDVLSYNLEKGNIFRDLYDLLIKHSPSDVASIALQSQLFASRSGDRIYEFLEKKCERTQEETLCLALQLIRKNCPDTARRLIEEFDSRTLIHHLIKQWPILFESSTNHRSGSSIVIFSEFMEQCLLGSHLSKIQVAISYVLKYLLVNIQVLPFDVLLKLMVDYSAMQIGCDSHGTGRKILLMTLELYLIDYYTYHQRIPRVGTKNSIESDEGEAAASDISMRTGNDFKATETSIFTDIDSCWSIFGPVATGKALKMLVRSYLGDLKGFSMQQNLDEPGKVRGEPKSTEDYEQLDQNINAIFGTHQKRSADCVGTFLKGLCGQDINLVSSEFSSNHPLRPILFLETRYNYLNFMPPLQDNFMDTYLSAKEELTGDLHCQEANISCVKIQALLCSEQVPIEVANEISQFVYANPHLIGIEAIISCLLPARETAELLTNVCPQALLEFSKERMHSEEDWRFVIQCLQRQINRDTSEVNVGVHLFYQRLLKETLEFIATNNSLEAVLRIFPEGGVNGELNNNPDQRESHYLNEMELEQNPFIQSVRQCLERERANKIRMVITAKHPKTEPPPPPPPRTSSRELPS